jgi:hypothetical protein
VGQGSGDHPPAVTKRRWKMLFGQEAAEVIAAQYEERQRFERQRFDPDRSDFCDVDARRRLEDWESLRGTSLPVERRADEQAAAAAQSVGIDWRLVGSGARSGRVSLSHEDKCALCAARVGLWEVRRAVERMQPDKSASPK